MFIRLSIAFALCCILSADSQAAVLNSRLIHLRNGEKPEWEDFAALKPEARRLDLTFTAKSNATEATLFIRQNDVRHDWFVELNGRRIGKLFTMEADLVHGVAVPPRLLREGENKLSIVPPRDNDDIFLREIELAERNPFAATAEATLSVRVTEKGAGVPCRITITDSNGALAALVVTNGLNSNGFLASRPGVVYTGAGAARIGLRAGTYTIYASRGFEYGVFTQKVHLAARDTKQVNLALTREVATPGLISCDTHVHTLTHSGHGDCSIDERMLTLAGEGIEFPIATDHNIHIDYEAPARRTGMRRHFTSVPGNEVTTPAGHFNIFPVATGAAVPDHKVTDWVKLTSALRGTPGVQVVVLNHPRNVHNNFQPFAATNFHAVSGENKRGPEFQFDAMELLNSSAQQSDHMLVYRDWFALLNYGYRITGVGSSDSHDVSRYIVGQGRTYIEAPDGDVSRIDVDTACSNLVAGRALVSMGLLAQMTVNKDFSTGDLVTNATESLKVRVQVSGPSWVSARRVELFANGVSVRVSDISSTQTRARGVKAIVEWNLPRPAHDIHLIAIATGPGVDAPFWATPKPYQPTSPVWVNRVFGVTNPIRVDSDGDGQFTAARGYAKELMRKHGTDTAQLAAALANYDETVAAQCASLGAKLDSSVAAKPHVLRGFEAYARGNW